MKRFIDRLLSRRVGAPPAGVILATLFSLALGACTPETPAETAVSQPPDQWWAKGTYLAPEAQRPGDPAKGWDALMNKGYVGCGIPASAFPMLKYVTPATPDETLAGRTGPAAEFPYKWNYHVTQEGVALAVPNCLLCHGGHFNGEMIVGLGDVESDFTADFAVVSKVVDFLEPLEDSLFTPGEVLELAKFTKRIRALGEVTKMRTVGTNPANEIGVLLFSHRDRHTLAWSDEPMMNLPSRERIPVDTPPWWRMAKKSTMFFNGMGRGDHRQTMMTASSLCVDDVEDAKEVDKYFNDIQAYILSIQPPKYPFAIDTTKTDLGRRVFNANCSGCHGTYGPDGEYPNLVVPVGVVRTDPVYAVAGAFLTQFVSWYNDSIYGTDARLEPNAGYVPPPLDAIWATAPFFHNGSVPTIEGVLDSTSRPKYWKRVDMDSRHFDEKALGWPFVAMAYGQQQASDLERKYIYDTSNVGHFNTGHTFGDHLTPVERSAVLEYLKTL